MLCTFCSVAVGHVGTAPAWSLQRTRWCTRAAGEGKGRQLADAMADKIKAHFRPHQIINGSNFRIELTKTPSAASGMPDDGRWCIPVSIYWRAFQR